MIVLGISLALVVAGAAVALVAFRDSGDNERAAADATDEAAVKAPIKQPVACDAELPSSAGSLKRSYGEPGDANLDPDKDYVLRLETSCGDIDITLDVEESPKTTNSIAFLARSRFFDGLFFHRISESVSVIQGGDPRGEGGGGPGYDVVEPPPDDFTYAKGVVAMAKTEADPPGTSGSQFFIVYGEGASELPPEYAVLGEVSKGMDVVERISKLSNPDETPKEYVYIERASVIER